MNIFGLTDIGAVRKDNQDSYAIRVLSENTASKELSARITENGFAFAFKALNDEDARNKLCDVINKLNSFENVSDKVNMPVFHSAVYHLSPADKNCEILLFNLRKN